MTEAVEQAAPRYVGVGVGAVIRRGDEILLLRRANVFGDGTWSTPGGHVEFGETLEQCAVREALEETGLVVEHPRFLAVTNDVMLADDKHYVTIWMQCDYTTGEPRIAADYEMSEVAWFTWDALPEPLFEPFARLLAGATTSPAVGWGIRGQRPRATD